jgi:N-acetylmuramoyl-L-alanine amidase
MGLTMPGVLVEMGFLDHAVEGAEMLERDRRAALAAAITLAILDARGLLGA